MTKKILGLTFQQFRKLTNSQKIERLKNYSNNKVKN